MRPMTVWLYELLDASMSCGDKKGWFRQAGQILPPQERGDFDGLNEQPLATRYIRRATYTCPSVNVMPD